jgi:hypothetical protein
VVIDVRPEHEYKSGHITNAISIPIDQLGFPLPAVRQTWTLVRSLFLPAGFIVRWKCCF